MAYNPWEWQFIDPSSGPLPPGAPNRPGRDAMSPGLGPYDVPNQDQTFYDSPYNVPNQGGGSSPYGPFPPTPAPQGPAFGPPVPPASAAEGPGFFGGLAARAQRNKGAISMLSGAGGGIGQLAGGLVNMFGGQPSALMEAYKSLQSAYSNLDDPNIQTKLWNSPVFKQIAQYAPELMRGMKESIEDYETYGEGDAELRGQEDEALARVTERSRRGDPLAQRIQTQQAQAGVGRALGRAGQTAQQMAARKGQPGAGISGQDFIQAGADYASRVGSQNVLAARQDMAGAERAALAGATGIRTGREASKERALNVRNNFRNAMSNRQLMVSMSNQKARQAASDKNQGLAQSLHMTNLSNADKRRVTNQERYNRNEMLDHELDLARIQRDSSVDQKIGAMQDENRRNEMGAVTNMLTDAGRFAGGAAGFFS